MIAYETPAPQALCPTKQASESLVKPSEMPKTVPSGLYAPLPAFFNDADELGKQCPS